MTVKGLLMEAMEGTRCDPKQTPLQGRELSTGSGMCLVEEGRVPGKGAHPGSASPHPPIPLLLPCTFEAQAQSAAGDSGSCQDLTRLI